MTTRRDFLKTTAGAGISAAALGTVSVPEALGAPALHLQEVVPVSVGSANGINAVAKAGEQVAAGVDTLEAVIAGVNLVEEDPEDTSVGYGGLPNLEGVVQLDSSVMHGPSRGAGAVACIEGVKRPSRVALDVMRYTDHVLLVGEGAQRFAASMGHPIEDLLTDRARLRWIEWRARMSDQDDYLMPGEAPGPEVPFKEEEDYGDPLLDSHDGVRPLGTINCNVVNRDGDISGVTTTSGLAYKIPGRVGDSPIVGAGLYVDNDVGACGSTGLGEAVIKTCGSHTVVEMMRQGMPPQEACLEALRRIVRFTTASYHLTPDGRPKFGVNYYAVNKRGEWGGASIWSGARFALSVDGDSRLEDSAYLFERV